MPFFDPASTSFTPRGVDTIEAWTRETPGKGTTMSFSASEPSRAPSFGIGQRIT
jgi:hypothetical protein